MHEKDNKLPLVSVVLRTYNRQDMLPSIIDSILLQDYQNFELIVVDDNSPDNTKEVLAKYKEKGIKAFYHTENKGVQNSSITGFNESSGKYISFCDDDDVWTDNNRLSKQVTFLENDTECKYGLITASVRIVRPDKQFIKIIKRPKNLLKHMIGGNGIIFTSANLIRRKVYEEVDGFDPKLPIGTDSNVYRKIVIAGYDVFFSPDVVIDYAEGHQRMTEINERTAEHCIFGNKYNLEKYSQYYDKYPSEKSKRLYALAYYYEQLYKFRSKKYLLINARRYYLASIKSNFFNYLSWAKILTSFFIK